MTSSFFYSLFHVSIALITLASASDVEATTSEESHAFMLPIKRDKATHQYMTRLQVGVGSSPMNVVIDIGGQSLWFNDDIGYNTSSYKYIDCNTDECPQDDLTVFCTTCSNISNALPRPCSVRFPCAIDDRNPIIMGHGSYHRQGSIINSLLGKDVLTINSTYVRGSRSKVPVSIPNFKVSYVRSGDIKALASGARGVVGLGNTPSSLPVQLFSIFNISNQFSICLPSSSTSTGAIFIGAGDKTACCRDSLMTTRLVPKFINSNLWPDDIHPSEYYIGVKFINIDGQNVSFDSSLLSFDNFDGFGGTRISTAVPYTVLHSDIYNPFLKLFVERATTLKIKKVDPVAPFGACFDSKSIEKAARDEFHVPFVDLVLEGNSSTYWRIHGHNSMVEVNQNVTCLAFVDGGTFHSGRVSGESLRTSIIIGGYQLENNYLEIDLASSELRFSSSLLAQGLTCSHLRGLYL